jgi:hypothetical protein
VRLVSIASENPEEPSVFKKSFQFQLSSINISLIDVEMREFVLLRMETVQSSFEVHRGGSVLRLSVDSLQLDDQNPQAPQPVVLLGKPMRGFPFFKVQAILPSGVPFLSTISYATISLQRMDVELDSTFLTDLYVLFSSLVKPKKVVLGPTEPNPIASTEGRYVTLNWLEMSPILINCRFNRTPGRVPFTRQSLQYIKYIPAIQGQLKLPGAIMRQLSDSASAIVHKLSGEYKTLAFYQLVELMGSKGKLMSTFGVTTIIAQALRIKQVSELEAEVSQFTTKQSEPFDNRKEMTGIFSQEAIKSIAELLGHHGLPESDFLSSILANTDLGLKMRVSGQGLVGLVYKTTVDPLSDVAVMQGATRRRVPRAFPNNSIDRFDALLSEAQSAIQKVKLGERVRMTVRATQSLFCLTTHFLFVFDRAQKKITSTMPIVDMEALNSDGEVELRVKVKGRKEEFGIQCEDREQCRKLQSYLKSQWMMIQYYNPCS